MSETAGTITAHSALVFLLATWPRRLAVGLLLLVPVLVTALGGFRTADPPPRDVAAGDPVDTGAYLAVPHYYFVSDAVDAYGLEDGQTWVGVVVDLTNQGERPISITFDDETFRLPASWVPENDGPAEVLRLDTASDVGQVQPGLRYEVALLWPTTAVANPPSELSLTMHRTIYREFNIEPGSFAWFSTEDSFDVALPIGDAPSQILDEDLLEDEE